MLDQVRLVLENEPEVAYALLFGSGASGGLRPDSDLDVEIELRRGAARDAQAIGALVARLESAARRRVDVALIDEATPALRYRIFRDGVLLLERDHAALVARKARAILDYLDFRPVEERCTEGVLRAASRPPSPGAPAVPPPPRRPPGPSPRSRPAAPPGFSCRPGSLRADSPP